MLDHDLVARIYVKLPLTDCGECGLPTCREFAEKIVVGEKTVFDCTQLENDIAQEISLMIDEYLR